MPSAHTASAVRLSVLLARESRRAVILRRGPTKVVRLIAWDRGTDVMEPGQWLRGRVYAERCDLSPDGELLVYFAAKYETPMATWTAVSRPPYFTALALWPKGDAWGGGGLWSSRRHLQLNHGAHEFVLAGGFELPRGFVVGPLGRQTGRGEDGPIAHQRLVRDGWTLSQIGERTEFSFKREMAWQYTEPMIYSKPSPSRPALVLERHLLGVHERNGPWYVFSYRIRDDATGGASDLGRMDWADWDVSGDLLYGRGGCLHRAPVGDRPVEDATKASRVLADFRDQEFENVAPPERARRWKG